VDGGGDGVLSVVYCSGLFFWGGPANGNLARCLWNVVDGGGGSGEGGGEGRRALVGSVVIRVRCHVRTAMGKGTM